MLTTFCRRQPQSTPEVFSSGISHNSTRPRGFMNLTKIFGSKKIDRKFTKKGESPYKGLTFKKVRSEIKNPNGETIFELNDVDAIPNLLSVVAANIPATCVP